MIVAPPPVELAVSPPRLVVAAGETRALRVTNLGSHPAAVSASAAGYRITLRGRPILLAHGPAFDLRPHAFSLAPGETATVAVTAPRTAEPGDHPALVLVGRAVGSMRLRVGVLVLVRGTGRVVHRIVVVRRRVRGRTLELWLRNAGNVSERLTRATVRIRLPCRYRVEPRELLPHSRGVFVIHAACKLVAGRR